MRRLLGRLPAPGLARGFALTLALTLFPLGSLFARDNWPTPPVVVDRAPQVSGPLTGGTADHTKFEVLKGPFDSGPEVTKACRLPHGDWRALHEEHPLDLVV